MNKVVIIFFAIGIIGILVGIWGGVNYSKAISQKNEIKEEYFSLKEDYIALNNSYIELQSSYNSLEKNYSNLQQKYTTLETKYSLLNNSYNTLQSEYYVLQSQYSNLQQNYNSLENYYNALLSNFNSLQSQYELLQQKYITLQSSYAQLNDSYSSLQNDYNTLQSEYYVLQSQYSNLQQNYSDLQDSYIELQSSYNSLETNYNSLQNEFSSYKRMIEIRYGLRENATCFVTPNDMDVINYKNLILESYGIPSDGILSWDDIDAIFDWIWWNTWYNYDTYIDDNTGYFYGEFWQYPNETLYNTDDWGYMLGDCEDFTVLMASLCKAEENVNWLWCAEITLTINSTEYRHACIFIDDGSLMRIYDPTNNYTTGVSLPEQDALNQYASFWGADSIQVDAIFNENQYIEFDNNQEFFTFF